jgi:Peptidase family M41
VASTPPVTTEFVAVATVSVASVRADEVVTSSTSREAVAYHEAGHAVISMKLGYRCLYVTIIPDGDRLGHVCCEDPLVVGLDDKVEHALKILIAASLAESKHIASRTWGDADDHVNAINLALLATDRDTERAEALINDVIGETRKLVERHWSDIEKLAEQLIVGGRVNFLQSKATASEGSDSR